MPLVTWNDSLCTHIAAIDREHKLLVAMLNDLHDAMKARQGKDVLAGIVERMKNYARTHFDTEERYFSRYAYPDAQAHIVQHQKFIEKVLDFDLAFQEGQAPMTMEVLNFLRDWLVTHIQGSDMKYAAFLKEQGVC